VFDYATQSRVTDPGRFTDRLSEIPGDLRQMRAAARQLVFHYRAGGDYAENGIDPGRIAEIDTRYARDMLARIFELADRPLTGKRAPSERIVGCCRDFTVLFLAMARQHGVPARARVGFATYFVPGWFLDHVIAEVWDTGQQRWRLIRGWFQVRHNLIQDLASLAMNEMLLWDDWGLGLVDGELAPEQLALLDALAAATCSSEVSDETIASFYQREEFRVPPVVTSFSPARGAPLQVAV
jgi:hypothetical protein